MIHRSTVVRGGLHTLNLKLNMYSSILFQTPHSNSYVLERFTAPVSSSTSIFIVLMGTIENDYSNIKSFMSSLWPS